MGRVTLTIVGLALVAVAAIFIAKGMLPTAKENVERREPVLTGEYRPQLQDCRILEDAELPESVEPPGIDADFLYVGIVVLYPGAAQTPDAEAHRLDEVNGAPGNLIEPAYAVSEVAEDGTYVDLVFKTSLGFEYAKLVRGSDLVVDRVSLE